MLGAAAVALAGIVALPVRASVAHSGSVVGNAEPELDPSAGRVEVAAVGAATDSVVPVIVRNASDGAVAGLRVTMVKSGPNGAPVTRAGARFVPGVLEPGAIAIGGVDFGTPDAALLPTVSTQVESRPVGSHPNGGDLTVRHLRQVAPTTVDGLPSFRMRLVNNTGGVVRGPISVTIMCFGESSRPTGVFTSSVDRDRLRRRAAMTAHVELATLCPSYLAGARGRTAA